MFENLLCAHLIGSLDLTGVQRLHVVMCLSPVAQLVIRAVLIKALQISSAIQSYGIHDNLLGPSHRGGLLCELCPPYIGCPGESLEPISHKKGEIR